MNKKLKKGLTTTMAAAMGLGVVIPAVPVIAAPATSGWVKTAAGWTYLKSGVKATGWVKDGGKWYFLDSNGIMKTGWVKDAGTWYFLSSSGAMVTGWFKDADGKWYFLDNSGAMAANKWIGNYYLGSTGAMLVSTVTPDGYTVNADGAWDGQPKASEKYAALKAAVDAKVKAYTDLANGDLSTQALIDAAKVAESKIDETGLTDADKLSVEATIAAADAKVAAAQKVIDDAKTYTELKAGVETKVAAYEAATADLSTQELVTAANAAKAVISLTGLTDADKAAFQTRIDAADAKVAAAVTKLAAEKDATDKVVAAEASRLKADVDAATTAVDALADGTVKTDLTARLAKIVVKAEVSSVSAVNATTVQVTLPAAPATALTNADLAKFEVKVDGTVVTPTALAKAANETTKYNLTIPTLAGKEGSLTVNDVAAAISGSDFGYDFKAPSLASATAVDKNHVLFTFSEKIDKAAFEGALFASKPVDVTDLAGNSLLAGGTYLAKVQADGKSALVTLDTAMDTFKGGYIAVANNVAGLVDIAGQQTGAANKVIFDGVGTASTTGPVALSAVYNPATSSTLVVKFDKAINNTIDKTKITVGGIALALGDTVTKTATNEITIALTSTTKAAYDAAANKDVAFASGAVKDIETTPNDMLAATVTPVSAAKITAATYDEASNKFTMTFDKAINISSLDLTKVTLNGEPLAASTTTVNVLTQTANSTTLEFTLSDATDLTNVEGAASTARALVLASGFATDVNGNPVADATYTSALTYTDDVTAPVVSSVSFNATTDKLTITASEDVTVTDNTLLAVYDGTTKLFDLSTGSAAVANTTPSTDKQYVKTLSGAELTAIEGANKSSLTFKVTDPTVSTNPAGLADVAGNKIAASTTAISYTDQDALALASTTQVAADKIELTFNKPVNASDAAVLSNYKVVKTGSSPEAVLPVTSAVLSGDGKSVILTVDKNSANYVGGYNYTVSTTVKDIYGNNYVAAGNDTITNYNTAATATAYALQNAVYADTNGDYTFNAGDKITLTFNGPVSISGDVVASEFAPTNMTLGTGFTVTQGSTPETVVVTLGTGAALTGTAFDTTQKLDLGATVTHILGANGVAVVANGTPVAIAKPDLVRPTLTAATYSDANGDGSIGAGDTLTMKFSENIVLANTTLGVATLTGAGNDFIISANGAVLDGTKASVSGDTLTVTLTSGTFVPGTDTLVGDAVSDSITDLWGNALNTGSTVTIAKSDSVAPTFSNVKIVKGTVGGVLNTGSILEAGDKVVFNTSEAVHKDASFTVGNLNFYAGPTAVPYTAADATNVVVDPVAKTVTITVATGDGWIGKDISALTKFNISVISGSTFLDANGNKIAPADGFGLTVTH